MANPTRFGDKDWRSGTAVDSGGHPAYVQDVNVTGGSGITAAVTIADGSDVAEGAKADTAYTTGSGSVIAILKGIFGRLLLPASLGRKTAALSLAVAPAGLAYETVAASATDQVLGGAGAAGDYLSHIVIQPVTTAAGAVTVKDGASTIFLFTSGTLADLGPKTVPFGIFSAGALSVTTGTNVTVIAVGNFT